MNQKQCVFIPEGMESVQQNGGGIYQILRATDLAQMLEGNNLSQNQTNNAQTQGETVWVAAED